MKKHEDAKHDPNQEAARLVREATSGTDALPKGLEAAWAAWSTRIQGCDERTMTLLRAAFEAGVEAALPHPPKHTIRRS